MNKGKGIGLAGKECTLFPLIVFTWCHVTSLSLAHLETYHPGHVCKLLVDHEGKNVTPFRASTRHFLSVILSDFGGNSLDFFMAEKQEKSTALPAQIFYSISEWPMGKIMSNTYVL